MKKIIRLLYKIVSVLPTANTPNSKIVKLRSFILRHLFNGIGCNCNIQQGVEFNGDYQNITIGDYSGIGKRSTLHSQGEIKIGNNVMIGQELIIHTARHGTKLHTNMTLQSSDYYPVSIGSNVWIGSRVTILPNVTICDDVVIGAGTIVSKNIVDKGIYAGNPVRKIKDLD